MAQPTPKLIAHAAAMNGNCRPRYGILKFLFDCTLVVLTGGLWLIWIFVREMRAR